MVGDRAGSHVRRFDPEADGSRGWCSSTVAQVNGGRGLVLDKITILFWFVLSAAVLIKLRLGQY